MGADRLYNVTKEEILWYVENNYNRTDTCIVLSKKHNCSYDTINDRIKKHRIRFKTRKPRVTKWQNTGFSKVNETKVEDNFKAIKEYKSEISKIKIGSVLKVEAKERECVWGVGRWKQVMLRKGRVIYKDEHKIIIDNGQRKDTVNLYSVLSKEVEIKIIGGNNGNLSKSG